MGLLDRLYSFMGLDILFDGSPSNESSHPKMPNNAAVALDSYWQGRNTAFVDEWSAEIRHNAHDLMSRVNLLLAELNVVSAKVVSGWRPREINQRIGGSPQSYHITGKAVDLRDNSNQDFAKLIIDNKHLLHKYQLWLENPQFTRGQHSNWIHLDTGNRQDRDLRVFNP